MFVKAVVLIINNYVIIPDVVTGKPIALLPRAPEINCGKKKHQFVQIF